MELTHHTTVPLSMNEETLVSKNNQELDDSRGVVFSILAEMGENKMTKKNIHPKDANKIFLCEEQQ